MADTYLLAMRCPVYRRRDSQLGSRAELENLSGDVKGKGTSGENREAESTEAPAIADRVAQIVVKQLIEPDLDPILLADSYGHRPGKSAPDAVGVTRERCWKYNWVLEFDIKGLFDNIDHELLLRAVRRHVKCKWALLYIERWLKAPMELEDGARVERTRGTPQGGVSPFLANLFMHYTLTMD
jgi:RNA-directed DNA polymerase